MHCSRHRAFVLYALLSSLVVKRIYLLWFFCVIYDTDFTKNVSNNFQDFNENCIDFAFIDVVLKTKTFSYGKWNKISKNSTVFSFYEQKNRNLLHMVNLQTKEVKNMFKGA